MVQSMAALASRTTTTTRAASAQGTVNDAHPDGEVSATSTTTYGAAASGVGSETSAGASKVKREQKGKLHRVKWTMIGSVIAVDLLLAGALLGQLISFNASLTDFGRTKVHNTFAFFEFQYNERFGFSELGLSRYSRSNLTCKALLDGAASVSGADAIEKLRLQFKNDRQWRTNEVVALLNSTGAVVSSSGPKTAEGRRFPVDGLIDLYLDQLGDSGGVPLRISTMIGADLYRLMDAPIFDAVGDWRPDLDSWATQEQTLARLLLMPVDCSGSGRPLGYIVNVDSIFPRQYDYFGTLLFSTKSGMGGIMARNTRTGQWQTAFSYNQPGPYGAEARFPDLARTVFTAAQLGEAVGAGPGAVLSGTFTYEDVTYQYAMSNVPSLSVSGRHLDAAPAQAEIVYVYAEPVVPARRTLLRSMSWQIPMIVIMVVWSLISVHFAVRKFIVPMQLLIASVKMRKMKEFNDHLRQLKSNKTAIWALLLEVITTEAVLVALIYVNDNLLNSVSGDFTSAATEGKVLSYVVSSPAMNLLYYLAAWSANQSLVAGALNRSSASRTLSDQLEAQRSYLGVDALCLLGLDSEIIASSHRPSLGNAFPESGVIEYLKSVEDAGQVSPPFLSSTVWKSSSVSMTTPGLVRGPKGSPALTRIIVAPVRQISINATTDDLEFGPLLGAIVIVRFLNGLDLIWDVKPFTPGYFGLFIWDRYHEQFRDLTSVQKTSDSLLHGVDITVENPSLLQGGYVSEFNADHTYVQNGAQLNGQAFAASVVPFHRSDEVVLAPALSSAFVVRGLSQSAWESVRLQLLFVQLVNVALVVLAALVKVVLAWLPMRRFLNSLERAFTVQSLSDEAATKREIIAANMLSHSQQQPQSQLQAPLSPHSPNPSYHVPSHQDSPVSRLAAIVAPAAGASTPKL